MKQQRDSEWGFSALEVIIIVVVVGMLAAVGWYVFARQKKGSQSAIPVRTVQNNPTPNSTASSAKGLLWQQTENGWRAMQTPPSCPAQPMMQLPADLSKLTSVLYPGQTRGGNYKPHGGLRFDTTANDQIRVTSPIDGYIVRGAQYLAEGEVQYTFDVMNNCGVMFRVGHLRVLPDNLQKIAATWPPAQEGDSRTNRVDPAVYIKKGDVLATTVGIIKDKNTFFDWGVYDYRQENAASKSAAYQQLHANDKELSWHAVCWLKDWVPSGVQTKLAALPAGDPTSGKNSDYCQ